MSVWAFHPRKIDPPVFVAEDASELYGRLGEYLAGPQCDGCGNWSYRLGAVWGERWTATCAADPTDLIEDRHPAPCGTVYRLVLRDPAEVTR